MKKQLSPIEKIKSRVFVDDNGCWIWEGALLRGGYGGINVSKKSHQVHRYMWELVNGEIPKGMLVCHKCDNPPCCNPSHLFLGSHKTNAEDKVSKNRQSRGESNKSKLTLEEVKKIKEMLESGVSHRGIAAEFGVGKTAITYINTGRCWGWAE